MRFAHGPLLYIKVAVLPIDQADITVRLSVAYASTSVQKRLDDLTAWDPLQAETAWLGAMYNNTVLCTSV